MKATLHSVSSSPHFGRIEFEHGRHESARFACIGKFEIDGEEWSVALEMIEPYRADMLGFFEELAAEKSGWAKEKRWDSEFSEMHLGAVNRGDGVVIFDIHMQWPPEYEEERKGVLHVRADELPRFADQMARLLRMKSGARFQRLRRGE